MPAPPTSPPKVYALSLMSLLYGLWLVLQQGPWRPALGAALPPRPDPCPLPVEVPRAGVACLDPGAREAAGLHPGEVMPGDSGSPQTFGPPARMAPARLLALGLPVDLNRATQAELEALPGVGPALARRIIEERPFADAAQVRRVAGIGTGRAALLRPLICVRP